jgi:hypothetical protein
LCLSFFGIQLSFLRSYYKIPKFALALINLLTSSACVIPLALERMAAA